MILRSVIVVQCRDQGRGGVCDILGVWTSPMNRIYVNFVNNLITVSIHGYFLVVFFFTNLWVYRESKKKSKYNYITTSGTYSEISYGGGIWIMRTPPSKKILVMPLLLLYYSSINTMNRKKWVTKKEKKIVRLKGVLYRQ